MSAQTKEWIILAGRRLNDGMGTYVAGRLVKAMIRKKIQVEGSRVLVLGLAFKENCPDLRNTRVIDVIRELEDYGASVDVHDPWVEAEEARAEYSIDMVGAPNKGVYDAMVLAVAHGDFREIGAQTVREYGRDAHILYDLKHVFPATESDLRL